MTAKTVHIDKLKAYLGTPPRSWLSATTDESKATVDPCTATSPLLPGTLIGPILPPSTGQHTVPRPANQQRDGAGKPRELPPLKERDNAGKQRHLVFGQPSSALPPPVERDVESECRIPYNSSVQWDADFIPAKKDIVRRVPATSNGKLSAYRRRLWRVKVVNRTTAVLNGMPSLFR